jgi:predicted RNA binding protein YcfA (HicA-like mRNA interferase family)
VKLPLLSSQELIKILKRLGFIELRQRGKPQIPQTP